jgi:uncharacterized membrane protein YkvA (DUF1232 family)
MKFLTDLKNFLVNTAKDQRIPERDKKILLAMIALVLSPFDIIPDWIPIFGVLDDIVILSLILDYFFSVLDQEVLLSHFPWTMKSYVRLKSITHVTQYLVPRFIKKKLWSYVGSPY